MLFIANVLQLILRYSCWLVLNVTRIDSVAKIAERQELWFKNLHNLGAQPSLVGPQILKADR